MNDLTRPKNDTAPRHAHAPSGGIRHIGSVIMTITLALASMPITATTPTQYFAGIQDHQNWTAFTRQDLPGHAWATNASDYRNTVLSIHMAPANQCQPELALMVNKADLGTKSWVTTFNRITAQVDNRAQTHWAGLALYQTSRIKDKASLIVDIQANPDSPDNLIHNLSTGHRLQLRIDARDQSMGTLNTQFSLAGVSKAVEVARQSCMAATSHTSAVSLSKLKL